MRIAILGPIEVRHVGEAGARTVGIAGARLRVLLTRLALEPGRTVSAERLIDDLWEDDPPAGAPNALQALVSRLRAAIGREVIESHAGGYRLAVPPDAVDAHEFETRVQAARNVADPRARALALREALSLWRGQALADAAHLPFAAAPSARLNELRRAAVEERAAADLELGHHHDLVPELQALAAADPLREPLRALLIRALYASGRQADALAEYESLRTALAETLGVDPSPALESLHLAVLRRDPALDAAPPPDPVPDPVPEPGPGSGPPPGNLRAQLTSFIGRDDDLRRVAARLSEGRFVTLTGPGGAGKTRLSQEAGRRATGLVPDGVWFVPLASVTDPGEVPSAVLSALGLREVTLLSTTSGWLTATEAGDPMSRLTGALAGKRMLIILDNCEHLLDAAARLADRVLAECPGARVLATSREPLGVTGETLYPVEPLEQPPPDVTADRATDFPAVRLLADRAAAVSPGFAVTTANVPDVVRVCRALDGMPLAIELAAARLRSLTLAQVADRLDDRFELLRAGSRTALPRHRTLRAVVEWSWDLLDTRERLLWRRLAAFPGGADLDAAESVCADAPQHRRATNDVPPLPAEHLPPAPTAPTPPPPDPTPRTPTAGDGSGELRAEDVLDVLAALVDKSLVVVVTEGPGGAPRYRMLETIRAYGLERLAEAGEEDRIRRAHAEYFAGFAEVAEPHLYRSEQLDWIARLNAEQDNLHAALRWAIDAGDGPLLVRFAAALGWYWFLRGRVNEAVESVVAITELPVLPPGQATARALALGVMAVFDGSVRADADATGWILRSRSLIEDVPDDEPLHPVLRLMMITVEMFVGGWSEGMLPGLAPLRSDPDPWVRGLGRFVSGHIELNFGRTGTGERYFAEALSAFREAGDRWGLSFTLTAQAELLARRGEHRAALDLYEEAVRLNHQFGGGPMVVLQTEMQLANQLTMLGETERAERILRTAREEVERIGAVEGMAALEHASAMIARRRGDLAGAVRLLDGAVALTAGLPGAPQFRAMVLAARAACDLDAGDADGARPRLAEALALATAAPDFPIIATVLCGLARLARSDGEPDRAAELLGRADALRGGPDLSHPDAIALEKDLRSVLGDSSYEAAYARGRSRTFEDLLATYDLPGPRPLALALTRPALDDADPPGRRRN
ncbi:BTAD domain-containing putative transcriptional regulator [Actinomadura gamaensis]|uniref:BTAD domain-containing putative transcriptional regulator n=1 Tax=Actinomadura gamaensis TaxID=1763541 RepID=A0ABV9U9Z8_9ACTN